MALGNAPGSSSQRGNLGFSLSVTVVPMLSSALRSFIHSTTSDRSRFTMPASRFTCSTPQWSHAGRLSSAPVSRYRLGKRVGLQVRFPFRLFIGLNFGMRYSEAAVQGPLSAGCRD